VLGATHDQDVTITNAGPDSAGTVTLKVTASTGQRLACVPADDYSCVGGLSRTTLTYTFHGVGTEEPVTASWTTTYTTATDKTITATVSGTNSDPQPANNSSVLQSSVGG
jgi:hypothetical protein